MQSRLGFADVTWTLRITGEMPPAYDPMTKAGANSRQQGHGAELPDQDHETGILDVEQAQAEVAKSPCSQAAQTD